MLNNNIKDLLKDKKPIGKFTIEDVGMHTVRFERVHNELVVFADKEEYKRHKKIVGRVSVRLIFSENAVEYYKDYKISLPEDVETELVMAKLLNVEPDWTKIQIGNGTPDALTYAVVAIMKAAKLPLQGLLQDLETLEITKPELKLNLVKDVDPKFNNGKPYLIYTWGELINKQKKTNKTTVAEAAKMLKGGK